MRKIIIVKGKYYGDYEDISVSVPVSDWSEVTDEEFKLLSGFLRPYDYSIIERVDSPEFIFKNVDLAIKQAKIHAEKEKKRKEEADKMKQQRLLKKKAKDEAAEKKLLEELQKKYQQ